MKSFRHAASAFFALALAGFAATGAQAAAVTNGDFSAGTAGWTFAGNVGIANSPIYVGCCAVGDTGTGNFAAFGGGNQPNTGSISQAFATTAGASYNLTFQYGAFSNPASIGTQSIAISVGDLATTLTSATSVQDLGFLFTTYNYTFTATGALSTLLFADMSGVNTNSIDGILDTISVSDARSVNAVPEPFTLSLFGAGLVGMGALRRRKNKAA